MIDASRGDGRGTPHGSVVDGSQGGTQVDAMGDDASSAALATVTSIAHRLLPECVGASISFRGRERPKTVAWRGDAAWIIDQRQYEAEMGPCLVAMEEGSPVHVRSLDDAERWTAVADAYRSVGAHSSLSVPVPTGGNGRAALNLYSTDGNAFRGAISVANALAREAGRILAEGDGARSGRPAAGSAGPATSGGSGGSGASGAAGGRDLLSHVGAVLVSEETLDEVLALVAGVTVRSLPAAAVSVTLTADGRPYTSTSTAPLAVDLDEAQYADDTGPCLDALRTGQAVNTVIEGGDERWPRFGDAADARGVRSVVSLPLVVRDDAIGVLNVYSLAASPFRDADEETATLLARQAAVVLANAIAFSTANALNQQLWDALETRDLIGQAKGIVMAQEGCSAETAFDILRRASQHTNRKLRDIALELVRAADRGRSPS